MTKKRVRFEFEPTPDELLVLRLLAKNTSRSIPWLVRDAVEASLVDHCSEIWEQANADDVTLPAEFAEPAAQAQQS